MNTLQNMTIAVLAALITAGCSATQHAADVRKADDIDRVTVGTVQKEIRTGMSAASVASALGSPNIVTTDNQRQETWIYDKISSDVNYSRSMAAAVASGEGPEENSMIWAIWRIWMNSRRTTP